MPHDARFLRCVSLREVASVVIPRLALFATNAEVPRTTQGVTSCDQTFAEVRENLVVHCTFTPLNNKNIKITIVWSVHLSTAMSILRYIRCVVEGVENV
jgi:hypothetical protein